MRVVAHDTTFLGHAKVLGHARLPKGYWYCWGGSCTWQSDSNWWIWLIVSIVVAIIAGLSVCLLLRRRRMRMQQQQAAYAEAMAAQQATAGAQGWSQGGPPPAGYPTDVPYTQNGYQGYPGAQGYPAPYTYPTYGNDTCATGTPQQQQQPVYGYPAPPPGQFQNIDLTQTGAANQQGGGKL